MDIETEMMQSKMEVLYVGGVISLSPMLIRVLVKACLPQTREGAMSFCLELISTLLVPLLIMTDSVSPLKAFFITIVAVNCLVLSQLSTLSNERALKHLRDLDQPRLQYLDNFRGGFMLATCIAILAVDFTVFPEHFAKSETYGKTVMDLGPGVIIFAGGLVSKPVPKSKGFQRSFCLCCFGLIRLFTTVLIGYDVNTSEYGLHWNFFFTLAAVSLLRTLFPVPGMKTGLFGFIILACYQFWLNSGLNEYIHMEDHEGSLIKQNKEGIFSVLGYWSIHLIGSCVGQCLSTASSFCLDQVEKKVGKAKATSGRFWLLVLYNLILAMAVCFFLLTLFAEEHLEQVSRRSCNLAYALWIAGFSLSLCMWNITIQIWNLEKHAFLTRAMNKNLLGVFLAANLMTGLVNIAIDSQSQTNFVATVILSIYALILASGAAWAETCGVYLKL